MQFCYVAYQKLALSFSQQAEVAVAPSGRWFMKMTGIPQSPCEAALMGA